MDNKRSGLQLLPGTKKRLGIKIPGENRFLYIGSAILGAVLVTSFALIRYEGNLKANSSQLDDQIQRIEQSRDKRAEQNLKNIKKQIELTSTILSGHVYWTDGLERLVGLLQSEIQINSLSVSTETGAINLEARASNFTVLARQIASFLAGEGIEDVVLGDVGVLTSGNLSFSMNIKFDKSKFVQR